MTGRQQRETRKFFVLWWVDAGLPYAGVWSNEIRANPLQNVA